MRCIHVLAALLAGAASPVFATEIDALALRDLPPADIVILGEVHDNPDHHANQAAAVSVVRPAALVFEMLTPDQAALVTPANRADAEALAEALDWEASGWADFGMYHPIFSAAPDAVIFGAALPRHEARALHGQSADAAFGADAARFGLDHPLDAADQARREAEQFAAHCDAIPAEMLPGMVQIQRLRDARLAQVALEAFETAGGPVVVITGTGHARTDQGIPRKLEHAAPGVAVLSIGQLEFAPEGDPPFDLWIITDPVDRPDPCDAFR